MSHYLTDLIFLALLSFFSFLTQTSHRQPNPQPPKNPEEVFDQLEQQQSKSSKGQLARKAAALHQRSANLLDLQHELPHLIELAQSLQNRLYESDLETVLPADVEKQAKELEQMARRIHKRIQNL